MVVRLLRKVLRALSRGAAEASYPSSVSGNPFDQLPRDSPMVVAPSPEQTVGR